MSAQNLQEKIEITGEEAYEIIQYFKGDIGSLSDELLKKANINKTADEYIEIYETYIKSDYMIIIEIDIYKKIWNGWIIDNLDNIEINFATLDEIEWVNHEYNFNILDFSYLYFPKISFWLSTFTKAADFPFTKFYQKTDFSSVSFLEHANFSFSKFYKDIDFSKCNFEKELSCSSAIFCGDTNFKNVAFKDMVYFKNSQFNEITKKCFTNFSGSIFQSYSNFSHCEFQQDTLFRYSLFKSNAFFENVKSNVIPDMVCTMFAKPTYLMGIETSTDIDQQINMRQNDTR